MVKTIIGCVLPLHFMQIILVHPATGRLFAVRFTAIQSLALSINSLFSEILSAEWYFAASRTAFVASFVLSFDPVLYERLYGTS